MKLAFSSRFVRLDIEGLIAFGKKMGIGGLEVCPDAFSGCKTELLRRRLINSSADISSLYINITGDKTADCEVFSSCLNIAHNTGCEYVTIGNAEKNTDYSAEFISAVLDSAEKNCVTLLIPTCGCFSDTLKLDAFLKNYETDCLAADWNMRETLFRGKESAEQTVKNLGAYIKYVHICDENSDGSPALLGDGNLPVKDMMNALRSVNYPGYIVLEWDKANMPEIDDDEAIYTHFRVFMETFGNPSKNCKHYYYNRTHTGKFIWEKERLIDKTFPQVLDEMVENFPDRTCIKFTTLDYERTYRTFRDDVDDFARSLIAMGVRPGSHVAVWATNVPAWYIAFWATVKIGAVLVTMNTAYKIHETEYLLKQSDTHTLIMIDKYRDSDYKAIIEELCPELATKQADAPLHCARLPFLRNVVTVGFSMSGGITWDEALSKGEKVSKEEVYRYARAVDKDDVCNMQYTSGTTGFPKGVMLTHYNVVNNGKCIGDRMDLSTADRMMIQVPMFHCFGMVLAMTASVTHGTAIFPLPYFSPKSALACINNEKITAFHGVPTMFIALLGHPDFPTTDFSHMRTGIMAGSPCPINYMQEVVSKMNMTDITIVYGQTEASPGCTMSSVDDSLEDRVATVGKALPEIECKIINPETGEECPDGETGEFVARGYNIMKGYYKMPAATSSAIDAEGWLHTGDLACRLPSGNFKITGRLKDMIIRGGENIYPKEIEEFLYTHPKINDVQVIGVPDEAMGEEICASIILKDGETMTESEVKAYVRDHMAKHKVPRYVDFVPAFPMNAAGKILKYKMREDAVEKFGLKKAAEVVTA